MVFCGTDWWGLTDQDESFAANVVGNLNLFPVIVDRLQQAVLNTLFLGRLMISAHGFAANPDFQAGGRSVLDTSHLYYNGNSQGGIMGGVTLAVSPDVRRAVLGVTGMDYGNLLLARSTDFTSFSQFLGIYYRDPSMYPVILDLLDQLWDRADPDGYAPYMTSHPLPDTPTHQVLMQIAYGDFQVSMYAGRPRRGRSVSRRTSRHSIPTAPATATCSTASRDPPLSVPRFRDRDLGQRPRRASSRHRSGTSRRPPAPTNIDPHQNPRNTPADQQQISDFLEPNGAVADVWAAPRVTRRCSHRRRASPMAYPVTFEVDYVERCSRLTASFRSIFVIPLAIWLVLYGLFRIPRDHHRVVRDRDHRPVPRWPVRVRRAVHASAGLPLTNAYAGLPCAPVSVVQRE